MHEINDYEILTPNGWSDFWGIKKVKSNNSYTIFLDSGEILCGAPTHKVRLIDNSFIKLHCLDESHILYGNKKIEAIEFSNEEIDLYDIIDIEKNNEYYTNDVVSHNCAFIHGMEEIWTGAQPTLSTGGDCIALSTPNGMGNWFHQEYTKAETGGQIEFDGQFKSFNPIKLHWSLHPERDEKWEKYMKSKISPMAFAQEHDTDFLQSGANVISYEDLQWYENNPSPGGNYSLDECPFIREPIEKGWMDKNFWVWKYPEPGKEYIIAVDTARGDGGDYSAFHILDVRDYEQVAEYRGQIPTDVYSNLVVSKATEYNNAFIVCENNGIGHSVCMGVLGHDYSNFYWTSRDVNKLHKDNADRFMINPYNVPENATPGFTMSSKTRPNVIARLEEDIRTHSLIIHSRRFFNEATVFVFQNGKPQAMDGYHDDLIMSMAIACFVRHNNVNIFGYSLEHTESMVNSISYRTNDKNEFSIINSVNMNVSPGQEFYQMKISNRENEDLRWLV